MLLATCKKSADLFELNKLVFLQMKSFIESAKEGKILTDYNLLVMLLFYLRCSNDKTWIFKCFIFCRNHYSVEFEHFNGVTF